MGSLVARSRDLAEVGPALWVHVGLTDQDEEAVRSEGGEVATPLRVVAMIDTGAEMSAIRPDIAQQLRLELVGQQRVNSATEQNVLCGKYAVKIIFSDVMEWEGPVVAADLGASSPPVLVGRDILRNAVLTYIGKANVFTLSL